MISWNRRRHPYRRFACFERDQIDVNVDADYRAYAASCYHAEQYAEKVIKDRLWCFKSEFYRIHKLSVLATDLALCYGIKESDPVMKDILERCYNLDDLYQRSRYPSYSEKKEKVFNRRIAERAVSDAEYIVAWVHGLRDPVAPMVS